MNLDRYKKDLEALVYKGECRRNSEAYSADRKSSGAIRFAIAPYALHEIKFDALTQRR